MTSRSAGLPLPPLRGGDEPPPDWRSGSRAVKHCDVRPSIEARHRWVHADRTSCMRLLAQSGGSCLLVQVNTLRKKTSCADTNLT